MRMSRLVFAPYDPTRDVEVRELFEFYPHKDYQLHTMGVSKERMAAYLETTLTEPHMQSICLRDNGRLMGLIALQRLPWMSRHFGVRMYAVRHLLVRSDGPLEHGRLVRFVIEELREVDFLDCRVAVDDIYSAHALELCGFRYVGAEVFMGRTLDLETETGPAGEAHIHPCNQDEREEVLDIVEETHIHNRFVYRSHDPDGSCDITVSTVGGQLLRCRSIPRDGGSFLARRGRIHYVENQRWIFSGRRHAGRQSGFHRSAEGEPQSRPRRGSQQSCPLPHGPQWRSVRCGPHAGQQLPVLADPVSQRLQSHLK